jgi:hypothetical protein
MWKADRVTREKEKVETDDSDIDIVEDVQPANMVPEKGKEKGKGKAKRIRG